MGKPKHLLRAAGMSFTAIAAAALRPHCDELVVLGDVDLPEDAAGLSCVPDAEGGGGPLAGIAAALAWRPEATWIVAACDMPLVTSGEVAWLLDEHRRVGAVATMPWLGDRPSPTFAVYGPGVAAAVRELLRSGRGPMALRYRVAVHTPSPDDPRRLGNANTPEELEALLGGA